jgi:hypothetical protein
MIREVFMVRKLLTGLITVAVFATGSFAQAYPSNARIDALGGAFIVTDPSGILAYAAQMNNYADNAQVTFNTPIWGVKSLGKVVNLGVVLNRPLMLSFPSDSGSFYGAARANLGAPISATGGNALGNGQNIPHVLFGLNLEAVKLGFDLFYEYSNYKQHIDDNPTAGNHVVTDVSGNIHNVGGIASAILDINGMSLQVKGGIGLPGTRGKREIETTPAGGTSVTVTTESSSESALFGVLGAELGLKVKEFNVTLGGEFVGSHFQMKNAAGVVQNNYFYRNLDLYAGFTTDVGKNGMAVLMYDFGFNSNGNEPDSLAYTPRKYYTNFIYNVIYAGYEHTWTKAWHFDTFKARAGLNYAIYSQIDHVKGEGTGGEYDSRTKHETVYDQVDPRLGIGITKSVFALDLGVNPTVWAGLISGPSVAKVTLSLDF